MAAKRYDRELGIRTVGLREWDGHRHYHRYEPTPYEALERLFEEYRFHEGDRVVDFGCGRGRVTFSIHYRFHVPVVGIEAHQKTYEEAVENQRYYQARAKHIEAPILLKYGLAENYRVDVEDNRFYFFNPFSYQVFRKVISNILKSVYEAPRTVDVILYYPLPEYQEVMRDVPFELIQQIGVPKARDAYDMFQIYRFSNSYV